MAKVKTPVKRKARPDKDGWIQWDGGGCPVNGDTLVDVNLRSGVINWECMAKQWRWGHANLSNDIIAYRISTPAPAPKPITMPESREDCYADIHNPEWIWGHIFTLEATVDSLAKEISIMKAQREKDPIDYKYTNTRIQDVLGRISALETKGDAE